MKTLIAAALCAMLVGCNETDNPTQSSYTEPQVDANTGLILMAPANDMWLTFEEVVAVYQSTMACMGLYANGPNVSYRSFSANYIGGIWAAYLANGDLVLVNTDEQQGLGFPLRDKRTDTEAIQHEFIHHILHENGMGVESSAHSSPLFKQCGVGVNVHN